jgi:hypothetical protein
MGVEQAGPVGVDHQADEDQHGHQRTALGRFAKIAPQIAEPTHPGFEQPFILGLRSADHAAGRSLSGHHGQPTGGSR